MAFESVSPFLAWDLSRWAAYGLFFLLGSFVVASVSDVKHLSAQREFMDVWWLFAGAMLVLDLNGAHWRLDAVIAVKWALIVLLSALSHRRVGIVFRLATGDVAALAAAASLLSPVLVVLFFLIVKLASYPLAPLLARGRNVYPFMPVVTAGTVGVLALGAWQGVV